MESGQVDVVEDEIKENGGWGGSLERKLGSGRTTHQQIPANSEMMQFGRRL